MRENMMADESAATKIYTKLTLSLYDVYVLGFCCRYIFKCPKDYFINLYNEHVSSNHLDVGVGSGFFLDKCTFPTPSPRIGLMDINNSCLNYVTRRLKNHEPETYQADILEPLAEDIEPFDSIGFCGVLHALPGYMEDKVACFDNLERLLNPGGTLFGCTILYHDVEVGPMAKKLTEFYNKKGILLNMNDRLAILEDKLKNTFSHSTVETKGAFAIFSATK